jgi:hypothetical protein
MADITQGLDTVRFKRYEDFWLGYLRSHSRLTTRLTHYVAALFFAFAALIAVLDFNPVPLLFGLAVAGALVSIGHGFGSRTHSSFWQYPAWSVRACYRMTYLALRGRLDDEMHRADSEAKHPRRHGPPS